VHLRPLQDVWVRFGEPIPVKEYEGREDDREAWREISGRLMDEIAALLTLPKAAKPWTPTAPTRAKFIEEQRAKAKAKAEAEQARVEAEAAEAEREPQEE